MTDISAPNPIPQSRKDGRNGRPVGLNTGQFDGRDERTGSGVDLAVQNRDTVVEDDIRQDVLAYFSEDEAGRTPSRVVFRQGDDGFELVEITDKDGNDMFDVIEDCDLGSDASATFSNHSDANAGGWEHILELNGAGHEPVMSVEESTALVDYEVENDIRQDVLAYFSEDEAGRTPSRVVFRQVDDGFELVEITDKDGNDMFDVIEDCDLGSDASATFSNHSEANAGGWEHILELSPIDEAGPDLNVESALS
jgi:hypothetical protein